MPPERPAILAALLSIAVTGCATPAVRSASDTGPAFRVHVFYYPWYGNPATDGQWSHWNHNIIPQPGGGGSSGQYAPPDDIGANFYPALGCYSSKDPATLSAHMLQIRHTGAGVLCLSWWGRNSPTDATVPFILEVAERYGLKVNFHLEPYPGRNVSTTREDLRYLIDRYGSSPAMYRHPGRGGRPLVYVYDSYLTPDHEWATILDPAAPGTIRGTPHDAIVIGLWVKKEHDAFVKNGQFDGAYTYFAVDGFTYGSTPANWPAMARWCREHDKIFIPSVGPGYDDTRIRPWNARNQRGRRSGAYYDAMFRSAVDVAPEIISITSFNEWHEGTQIEPAVPKTISGYTYIDYSSRAPDYYLTRTRYWVDVFRRTAARPRGDS